MENHQNTYLFKKHEITATMSNFPQIIHQYKTDSESVYNTWFVDNDQRLKAFRTIRRGVLQVIEDIKNKTFPNDFKESSLEFVLGSIAEQKQVFAGVAHPFYWKPKLRIPDIYENQDNKISNGELIAYIQNNVSKVAFSQNREQDPGMSGDPDKVLMSYR